RGDATGVVLDIDNLALGYTRTDATSRIVYLHLTGVTRAAEQIGDRVSREARKRQQTEEEDEAELQSEELEDTSP
ncbi:MAG: hypothetical protein HKN10_10960, partial [Myxococcales bacterium]|nr:hypothetical protein [Myxococcales bacterium]